MAVIGGLLAFLWVLAVIIIVGLIILGLVIGLIVGLFKMSYELGCYSGFLTFTLWVGIMLFDLKVINPYFGYSVAHVVAVTSLVICGALLLFFTRLNFKKYAEEHYEKHVNQNGFIDGSR